MAGGVVDMGGAFETEVVALRGDDVAMGRLRIVIGNDVSDRLTVDRLDDGLVRELVFFDADQLREAYDELDRQWVEFAGGGSDWLRRSRAVPGGGRVRRRGCPPLAAGTTTSSRSTIDHSDSAPEPRDDFVETFRSDSDGMTVIRSFQLVEPIEVDEGGGLAAVRFTGLG